MTRRHFRMNNSLYGIILYKKSNRHFISHLPDFFRGNLPDIQMRIIFIKILF